MKRISIIGILSISLFVASCSSNKNLTNSSKDGSSIENAIKVSSVSEEYQYVRNVCENCQFIMQSLIFEKNEPYDLLEFKNAKGEKKLYYFDISKFYGKMFK